MGGTVTVLVGADRFEGDLLKAAEMLKDLSVPMRQTSKIILQAAKATVPRDTGALAASMVPYADKMTASVSSPLPYAGVIHWGWPAHNIESNPWLLDAARKSEPVWVAKFQDYIEQVMSIMDRNYFA